MSSAEAEALKAEFGEKRFVVSEQEKDTHTHTHFSGSTMVVLFCFVLF